MIALGALASSEGRPRIQSTSPLTVRGTDVSSSLVHAAFCAVAAYCQCSSIWWTASSGGPASPSSAKSAEGVRLKRSGKSAEFAQPSGTV